MMTMTRSRLSGVFAIAAAVGSGAISGCAGTREASPAGSPAVAATGSAQPRNDYGRPDSWLCRPGRQDACAVDLTATSITADGKLEREDWKADPDAPVDCFYVYPTVSLDPTPISDMEAGPEERRAVELQLARFGSKCRLFAPMYRQVTMAGLREALIAKRLPNFGAGYGDVVDAWNHYLRHDNLGRGIVLVGHSQGSRILIRLLHEEIEGKPVQKQIVSALILGANFTPPPPGSDSRLPMCTSPTQTGCVISFVSFRSTSPPPANARFGRAPDGGRAACSNPAALGGGPGELRAYLSTRGTLTGSQQPYPWVKQGAAVTTPFVRLPGLITGECVSKDGASYLSVSLHAEPGSPRTDDIPGDLVVDGKVLRDWGLHLVDVNLAMGNLVDVVGQQARAYLDRRPR
jgi:DUF3089 family protein